MKTPAPVQGLVIRYNYLWLEEARSGLTEGVKDRPCAIVIYVSRTGRASVVPITHSPPDLGQEDLSLEIPEEVCASIGLDQQTNWIRLDEINSFDWPSEFLRPRPDKPERCDYGMIPKEFYEQIRDRLVRLAEARRIARINRT